MFDRKLTKVGLLFVDNSSVFQSRIFCTRWVGYAKEMSVSDIEEEMRGIYGIEFSTFAIPIIANKVIQVAQEWQNRSLGLVYLIAWMDGIIFKIRDNGKIINKTFTFASD